MEITAATAKLLRQATKHLKDAETFSKIPGNTLAAIHSQEQLFKAQRAFKKLKAIKKLKKSKVVKTAEDSNMKKVSILKELKPFFKKKVDILSGKYVTKAQKPFNKTAPKKKGQFPTKAYLENKKILEEAQKVQKDTALLAGGAVGTGFATGYVTSKIAMKIPGFRLKNIVTKIKGFAKTKADQVQKNISIAAEKMQGIKTNIKKSVSGIRSSKGGKESKGKKRYSLAALGAAGLGGIALNSAFSKNQNRPIRPSSQFVR